MKKRSISLILVLCLLACMLPATVFAAEAVASGTCGENLTWTPDDSGLLKISGMGEMNNYLDYHAEWYDYREQIVSIIIEDGVTSIGDYAFYDCDNLVSAEIPGSVLTIGQCAFLFCDNLASVTLSHGITVIKESTFGECTNITSITLLTA